MPRFTRNLSTKTSQLKTFGADIVVRIWDGGSRDEQGNWVDAEPIEYSIMASVEPIESSRIVLPEGVHKVGKIQVYYLDQDLPFALPEKSVIVWESEEYEVTGVSAYDQDISQAQATLIQETESTSRTVNYSPTQDELEKRLREIIALGSRLPRSMVIDANKNAPDPKATYATILLITDNRRGWGTHIYIDRKEDEDVDEYASECREAVYDITWFGDESVDCAKEFSKWLTSSPGILAAQRRKITFVGYTEVRQNDQVVDGQWEKRAIITITFAYDLVAVHNVGRIESVEIIVNKDDLTETIEV